MTADITWARTDTTITVRRTPDAEAVIITQVIAAFDIVPGAIPDQKRRYGVQTFRPTRAFALWENTVLRKVTVSGPRVLKNRLSDHETRDYTWERYFGTQPVDLDELPGALADALRAFEQAPENTTVEVSVG